MTSHDLNDRVIVITGGARGLGRAIAEHSLAAGAGVVVLADIRGELAKQTASDLSERAGAGRAVSVEVDVRDWAAVGALFADVEREYGRVDGCVTSAGVQSIAPSEEMTEENWNSVLSVNLGGLFATAQAAGRVMLRQGGGSIVNIASVAGVMALPGRAPYCSSKAAVISLTKVLGTEWAARGVRVNGIGPGWVGTDLVRDAITAGHLSESDIARRTPLGRLGEPAEIAEVAVFLLSDRSSYITGQTLFPDGGFSAFGGWR
jgi:3-oxoacyl-[acyl-carrier protein] reductase